ncbi:unnamed protein product [Blepharisma stoltei]|uniref:Uncharacterized protein n=1 Tax=Blepharisma stoltei TaxID=1481888 RepID=A0AAU9IHG7_9CILI|nr:unnamed protein product [Blepharisma stoltei]
MEEVEETKPQKRQYERVTLETVIPPLPPKSERIPAPDEQKLEREVKAIEREIEKLKALKDGIQEAITLKKEGGKAESRDVSVKEEKNLKLNNVKDWRGELSRLHERFNVLKEEYSNLIEDNKRIKPKIQIFDEDDIDKTIEEIEVKLETTTMPLPEEKKLIQRLGFLRQSRPLATEFKARSARIAELKKEKDAVWAQIEGLKTQMTAARSEIDTITAKMKESKEKLKVEIPQLVEERKQIQEKIKELIEKKKQVNDEFYEQKRKHMDQKRHIEYIERATKIKERLIEQEERKKAEEERKKLEEENKPHPYEREITQCENFISYLHRLAPASEEESKEESKTQSNEEFLAGKEQRGAQESEQWFGQAKKKTKKKRERTKKKEAEPLLALPIELLNFFSFTGIKVPTKSEEIPATIEELEKKRNYFESLEERVEEKEEKTKVKAQPERSEIKFTDFPAPVESQVKEEYGIFKDEGPVPKKEETKPTRGKRNFRRGN